MTLSTVPSRPLPGHADRRSTRWPGLARAVVLLGLLAGGCDGDNDTDGGLDASLDAGRIACSSDRECHDGVACNGEERCQIADGESVGVCMPGTPPCGDGDCNEDTGECGSGCPDADGDGAPDRACGGSDCDDSDPLRYPGATEVCDVDNRDEDCDERTFGVRDADGDSSPDAQCCNGDNCGDDCDDTRSAVHPLNVETCDGLDNDCDGRVDETVLSTFYIDADGDDFGSMADDAETRQACAAPVGFASNATDCDDTQGGVNPGVPEDCDGGDEDCDGTIDENCNCAVPSSRSCPGAMGVCAAGTQDCEEGRWGDCSIQPQPETCDGVDNNCNGAIDDGVGVRCWDDPDGDGFAASTAPSTMRCTCSVGETAREPAGPSSIDCREASSGGADPVAARTFPGAEEVCDGIDNDCSSGGGAVPEEDADGDMHTATGYLGCTGGPFPKTDCNDRRGSVNPGVTRYHDIGFCPPGRIRCPCGRDAVPRCIVGFVCSTCLEDHGSDPLFDYDCSGTTDVQPQQAGACFGSCTTMCVNSGCGPVEPQPESRCGEEVPYRCCSGCPCRNRVSDEALGCR